MNRQQKSRKQKASKQHSQDQREMKKQALKQQEDAINIGYIGITLLIWGGIGLLFSIYFNSIDKRNEYKVTPKQQSILDVKAVINLKQPAHQIGPLVVDTEGEVFEVNVHAYLPQNHWSFMEIEVLDKNEEYMYSFGQELWRETGSDSDGKWSESRLDFGTKITFPRAGLYYLNFLVDSKASKNPKLVDVIVTKRIGSDILHFWLGIVSLIAGLVFVELHYGVFRKTLKVLDENN